MTALPERLLALRDQLYSEGDEYGAYDLLDEAATALQSSVGGEVAKYEWFDSVAGVWKPVNRLPYTWEAELGIPWRASTLTASPAQPSDGWRTMDSAPRDGTRVLAVCMSANEHVQHRVGRMAVTGFCDGGWGEFNRANWPATHWMPLPAPPLTAAPSAPLDVAGGDRAR